jgi:hypothetical protein
MVTINYKGRLGNNMFQYAVGRLIAAHNGLKLKTEWNHPEFLEATKNPDGDEIDGRVIKIEDVGPINRTDCSNPLLTDYHNWQVNVNGFFQDAAFYNQYRDEIRGFWKLPAAPKNTEDLVIHLRLTDYWWYRNKSCVIHPEWYYSIIKKEKYKKLYIVVEPHSTNKKYLSYFAQFKPVIVSGTPKSDFEFMMSFDRIVCSNSTFAWWAAFLSTASKIWIHKQWMGLDRTCSRLVDMTGAIVLDSKFIRDKKYYPLDWTDYWKKPDSFFDGLDS